VKTVSGKTKVEALDTSIRGEAALELAVESIWDENSLVFNFQKSAAFAHWLFLLIHFL
jgi:hypothetical protein